MLYDLSLPAPDLHTFRLYWGWIQRKVDHWNEGSHAPHQKWHSSRYMRGKKLVSMRVQLTTRITHTGAGPLRRVTLTLTHSKANRRHLEQGNLATSG